MGLRDQLSNDLKDALRQHDEVRKRTVRSVVAAMQQAEAELDSTGARVSLGEQDIQVLIAKQVKQRLESIAAYQAGRRPDLVAEEEAEMAILQTYLPQQLGRAEVEAAAREVIAEVGAAKLQDIGKVMKPLLARLRGKADGQLVNQVVRELLAG
jgi:uncharacterized protein YqeY